MKTIEVSDEELRQLLQRDESHFLDFKAHGVGGRALQKAAVAFSNSDGGELLIGIRDKSAGFELDDRWEGISDIEEMNSHLQVLFDVSPPLDLNYSILKRNSAQGYALRVLIEKGGQVSSVADGTVYVRQGAQSLPLKDPERVQQLTYAKGASSFEDSLLSELPAEQVVESVALRSFLEDYSPKTDPLEFCINQNLLDYKSWQPRIACALLFHPIPSAVVPRKCAVKITRYETREEEPDRDQLAEQATIEGACYQLIHDTVEKVSELMSSVEVWTAEGLRKLAYPPEAIWETVVNAVIHRDYSISEDIQIFIFDDRIEIQSPGKLPGYVTIENILDARYSRNSKLVRTLNRYKEPPNRDLGEGLNTTFQKMKEFGLKSPTFSEDGHYFKVTLPHTPLAAPTIAIMRFLKSHDQVTNRQARDITGIRSENLVKVEFYKLRDEDHLERVPGLAGPKAAWRATEKGKQFISELDED